MAATVWAKGSPETAVRTNGKIDRWWHQFRLGWHWRPDKMRSVMTAWPATDDPVAQAREWERLLR